MHPWAADPRTVGALAGTQLAIMSSLSSTDDNHDSVQNALPCRPAKGIRKYPQQDEKDSTRRPKKINWLDENMKQHFELKLIPLPNQL